MADTAARLALVARRYEVYRFTIAVIGIDLTGVAMNMQVRLNRGTPGPPQIALGTVTTAAAEGLKLDSVTVTDGVPTSIIKGRINQSTMSDAAKLPYEGEVGADSLFQYAMQWTLDGDARTRVEGDFRVRDQAYGSDNAPYNRPSSSGGSQAGYAGTSSGSLTFGDQVIRVSLDAAEQVGLLLARSSGFADAAAAAAATAIQQSADLQLSEWLGRPIAPVSGGASLSSNWRVYAIPARHSGVLVSVALYSRLSSGQTATLRIGRFAKSGAVGDYTSAGRNFTPKAPPTLVTFTGGGLKSLAIVMPVTAGDFVGFSCDTADAIAIIANAGGDSGGYFAAAPATNETTFAAGSINVTDQPQIGIALSYSYVTAGRVQALEAATKSVRPYRSIVITPRPLISADAPRQNVTSSVLAKRVDLNNTSVTFSGFRIRAYDSFGALIALLPTSDPASAGFSGTFTVSEDQSLFWDWNDTTTPIKVVASTTPPSGNYVLLASRKNGYIQSGELADLINRSLDQAALYSYLQFSPLPLISVGSPPNVTRNLTVRTVDFNNTSVALTTYRITAFDAQGLAVQTLRDPGGSGLGFNGTFVVPENGNLVWDWTDAANPVKVVDDTTLPARYVLLTRRKNGRLQSGAMSDLFNEALRRDEGAVVPASAVTTATIKSGIYASQGITLVGDKLWSFGKSDTDHNTQPSYQYDKNTLAPVAGNGRIDFNVSHAASIDYSALLDAIMVGNGGNTGGDTGRLDLMLNASVYAPGDFMDFNTKPRVSVELTIKDSNGAVTSNVFGTTGSGRCGAAFDGDGRTVYIVNASTDVPFAIVKALLGTGANDFSGVSGGFGAFIAGQAANVPNGTLKVLRVWRCAGLGSLQDLAVRDGRILIGLSIGGGSARVADVCELVLNEDGSVGVSRRWSWPGPAADGSQSHPEIEGICTDGVYLYGTVAGAGLVRWPLNGRQAGRGNVGARVDFPFPGTSAPNVQLTSLPPFSGAIGLSAVDRTGFTVAGPVGAAFVWSAPVT